MAPCGAQPKKKGGGLNVWRLDGGALQLADGSELYAKLDEKTGCKAGKIWLGPLNVATLGFDNGTLPAASCPGQCLSATSLGLSDCDAADSQGWSLTPTYQHDESSSASVPVLPRAYSMLALGRDGTNNTVAISYARQAG